MATRFNNAIRSILADAATAEFAGGKIDIYTDTQPASANDAATGTLLVTVDLPTPAFGDAVDGVASKLGSWFGVAEATGTAGWFRMRNAGDTLRKDGEVTATAGGGEIEIDTTSIVENGVVVINTATYTQPAE